MFIDITGQQREISGGQLISFVVHLFTAFCRETRRLSGVVSDIVALFRFSRTVDFEGDAGAVTVDVLAE